MDEAMELVARALDELDREGAVCYSHIAMTPPEHEWNWRGVDENAFLIVEGWDDVEAIAKKMLELDSELEEAFREAPKYYGKYDYSDILDHVIDGAWGFSDEYGTCSSCGCAVCFSDAEFIIGDGELTCFDCIDPAWYADEYLPYTADVRDQIAAQDGKMHLDLMLGKEKLAEYGYEPYMTDLAEGMYEHRTYTDPISAIESAPQGFEYVVEPRHISSFFSNPFEYEYEIWRRKI